MRKTALSAVAAIALATPALAADMKVKAAAPPPPPPSPWDVAFGAGLTSDYIFRGITQLATTTRRCLPTSSHATT